jgi:hypothetical protein
MDNDVKAFRVSEFCQIYVISKASFYREVTAKKLTIIKRGRTTLITKDKAERWFASLSDTPQILTN